MHDELKPCPFCGRKAQIYETNPNELGKVRYGVGCPNHRCHIYYNYGIKVYQTIQEAVDAWNTREPHVETKLIYEGSYMATTDGRIMDSEGLLLKETMGESGYPVVEVTINKRKTSMVVKYVIAETFLSKPKGAKYVINLNGNVWDNRVDNLMWCNGKEYGAILEEQRERELEEEQRRLEEEKHQRELEEELESQLDQIIEEYGLFY